ncbi:MAG TPA: flagellar hook protein FlgE [Symbiobacteriaceae bacterium]|nr:flagellar hook protein FlgE [Symbiobacteriaceae bacterium]
MMRALAAGVQGMRVHQVRMDVIGNNIANVNTTAFKASRVSFAEQYNQTMQGATSPGVTRGGVNPKQVGLGVGVAAIETIQEPGNLQATGKATDLALSGNGFFVLRDGGRYVYTRAGNFDFDSDGFLVNPATGQRVQGWMPDKTTSTFPTQDIANMTDIQLPVADAVLAKQTGLVHFDQSLNAAAPIGTVHTAAATVLDSLGNEHVVTLTLTKAAANTWDVAASCTGATVTSLTATGSLDYGAGITELRFDGSGQLVDSTPLVTNDSFQMNVVLDAFANGATDPQTVALDFGSVIQPAFKADTDPSTLRALDYDGYPSGALDRIFIDTKGVVTGYYTNGQYREVAQVAVANFFNPAGLLKDANNNWIESPNSGWALIGAAGESGRGVIASSNLEMSNVDISQEFTNMIITQRGFQANSRIITTADEMLQEVVNLKR